MRCQVRRRGCAVRTLAAVACICCVCVCVRVCARVRARKRELVRCLHVRVWCTDTCELRVSTCARDSPVKLMQMCRMQLGKQTSLPA